MKTIKKRITLYYLLFIAIFFSACDKYRVYESNIDMKDMKWYADSVKKYTFLIEDSQINYNLLYNVRNTLNYPYYNLYIKYELKDSTGKTLSTDLQEVQLMDAKTGEPFGSGLGDIFDHRFYAIKNFKFPAAGRYTMTVKQYMRQDPITEIMAFGIRVERAATL